MSHRHHRGGHAGRKAVPLRCAGLVQQVGDRLSHASSPGSSHDDSGSDAWPCGNDSRSAK